MTDAHLFLLLFSFTVLGICLEHGRALFAKRAWMAKKGITKRRWTTNSQSYTRGSPVTDAAEQLRIVTGAEFGKRRLLSNAEARVLYTAERTINQAKLGWRVMAQVSLGEILSSPDANAYAAINSKRVDILIITNSGVPIAAIEYQGEGHYQGSAAARDAVKKEALRKAGVRYIEVSHDHNPADLAHEIMRIAKLDHLKPAPETP